MTKIFETNEHSEAHNSGKEAMLKFRQEKYAEVKQTVDEALEGWDGSRLVLVLHKGKHVQSILVGTDDIMTDLNIVHALDEMQNKLIHDIQEAILHNPGEDSPKADKEEKKRSHQKKTS